MSTDYSKALLSGSTNGRQIAITGTTAPGVLVHIPSTIAGVLDEIWLYGVNNGTTQTTLYTQWGGTTVNDQLSIVLNGSVGRTLVADGRIINTGTVGAWCSSGGTVCVDGFVNRISPISLSVDPRVTDWVNRVVTNGGAIPSLNTQLVLSLFVQGLASVGLLSSMLMVNCFVTDSLTAALTPLIKGTGFDPWVGSNLVAGDLTSTGIKGNGSNKFIDTGMNPALLVGANAGNPQSDIGITTYVPDLASTVASNFADNGIISTSNSSQNFDLLPAITSLAVWDTGGTATGNVLTAVNLNGFYSGNRVSASDSRLFFANSTNAIAQYGATAAGASNAPLSGTFYVLAAHDLNGNVANLFSTRNTSFFALHHGLSLAQSSSLFNLVQALRVNLGGGFV